MTPDSLPALTASYRNQLLLSYAPGRTKPKLGMKRSKPEKKGTIFVQKNAEEKTHDGVMQKTAAKAGFEDLK